MVLIITITAKILLITIKNKWIKCKVGERPVLKTMLIIKCSFRERKDLDIVEIKVDPCTSIIKVKI